MWFIFVSSAWLLTKTGPPSIAGPWRCVHCVHWLAGLCVIRYFHKNEQLVTNQEKLFTTRFRGPLKVISVSGSNLKATDEKGKIYKTVLQKVKILQQRDNKLEPITEERAEAANSCTQKGVTIIPTSEKTGICSGRNLFSPPVSQSPVPSALLPSETRNHSYNLPSNRNNQATGKNVCWILMSRDD